MPWLRKVKFVDCGPRVGATVAVSTSGRHRLGAPGCSNVRNVPLRTGPAPWVSPATAHGRRAMLAGLAVATVGALGVAVVAMLLGPGPRPHATPAAILGTSAAVQASTLGGSVPSGTTPGGTPGSAPAAVPAVRATVLDIPALGLHGDLVDLGIGPDGALQPPDSPDVAGWFTSGALPGEVGPTVVAGHVDSRTGPGVFFRLKDLQPGDEVRVGRSDGTTARYRIVDVETFSKDTFPTERVYGPTAGAELRLITCGGEFDRSARRYLRNVIVRAALVDTA